MEPDNNTKHNNKKPLRGTPSRHHAQSLVSIRSLGYCHRPKLTADPLEGTLCSFRSSASIFKILIAKPRLKFVVTHRESSPLRISNRERIAIFHLISVPPPTAWRPLPRFTTRVLTSPRPPIWHRWHRAHREFLIVTPESKIQVRPAETIDSQFLIVTKRGFGSSERPEAA